MIGDIPIFDCVVHAYDLSDANLRDDELSAAHARDQLIHSGASSGATSRNPDYEGPRDFDRRWGPEEMYDLVFAQSPTDLAVAQVVPVFDWFSDWFAPVQAQYEFAAAYPERVLFCGGVDPLFEGVPAALEHMRHQVEDLGACSIKFYNGHLERSWRCDDRDLAYPLYERAGDLGVRVVQFHKGFPFGKQNMEDLSPLDLQRAARDFPDLTFVIHHLAAPYFEECVSIGGRFPNVYLALSANLNQYLVSPRQVEHQLGRLLRDVGAEKLLWGSEAALAGSPAPYLDAFMTMQIPDELQYGYGYPAITDDDRRRILGANLAELLGIDLHARVEALATASGR